MNDEEKNVHNDDSIDDEKVLKHINKDMER